MKRKNHLNCEPEMKWALFTAGIDTDPVTLAKHLTLLCTAAFSATVLFVAYNQTKKRPQIAQYTQCTEDLLSDQELSAGDQTSPCQSFTVENCEIIGPPDKLMNLETRLDDVQCPPTTPTECALDSTVDVDLAKDGLGDECPPITDAPTLQIQPSTASCCLASDPIFATHDAYMLAGVRQDENSSNSCGIDQVETQTAPPNVGSIFNSSSDVCGIDNAETHTLPSIMESVLDSTCGVSVAADAFVGGALSSVESLITQTQPHTISTASGPDEFAAGGLDDTCYGSGFTEDPDCTRAKEGFIRHIKERELPVRNREGLDAIPCDSLEEVDDQGSHFEGYVCGIMRGKGRKSCKGRLYRGILFSERWEQGDGSCPGERIDSRGSDCVKFHEACTQVTSGVQVCDNVRIERPQKTVGENSKKHLDFISSPDGCENSVEESRPWQCDSCTQTKAANNGASIPVDSFGSREASTGRLMEESPTMTNPDKTRYLGNNFECCSGKCVDSLSAYSSSRCCTGGVLKQLPISAREETRRFPSNSYEKCRDKGTNTSVDPYPVYRTRGAWGGRPIRQPRVISKEKTFQSIDNRLGVVGRCNEERSQYGITCDPFEKTKSSLKTLTETQHWSKISRPDQYERLGLLDSTLTAASEQQIGRGTRNVTYWRHKDSSPSSKFSVLSSLCKPQDSSECPTVDCHEDMNCTCTPSSSCSQVEQYCAEVTCQEAQQILQDKQVHRAGNLQQTSVSTTCSSLSYRPPRSPQNSMHDESNCSVNFSAEARRLHSEAAREARTLSKLLASNTRYHYM